MLLLAAALLTASLGDFTLQTGQVIHDCRLGYRTYGQMNSAKSNIVFFPTWFNGTTADMEKYIGATGLVNDGKFFVVTLDALSNGVSSSPSNSASQHGKLFPRITITDMVKAEHQFLTENLKISHVYAVMGISMGGMQTFQWLTAYPDFMDRAVTIVGTPRMGEKDILLWSTFMNGMHLGRPAAGADGTTPSPTKSIMSQILTAAPSVVEGMLSPQVRQQLNQIFQGGNQPGNTPPPPTEAGASGAVKTPVAIPVDKNPENVLHQFEAMVVHDISRPYGSSWPTTAGVIKAKCLVINSVQDKAVSPEFPQTFADQIKAQKFMMQGPCGHNAYKPDCEEASIVPVIRKFLEQ